MFITVDFEDKRPIYQQVVDGVKALIASGELREGMALPSVRQVAGDLGVNLNTVANAYRQLQEEGFLKVRHGSGAVVSSRRGSSAEQKEARKTLRTVITQLVLTGYSNEGIADLVRQELASLQKKGATQ